tara:strand:- start:137096 stop:138229 length:1134 start_codon:yes stop_codon:yes gene_type:complete
MPIEEVNHQVLLITRNLPPLVGGMERLMQNMASGIAQYSQLTVIGPQGCAAFLPHGTRVLETPAKPIPFLLVSTWLSIRECRHTKFDLVVGGSGLIGPTLRILRSLFSYETLVYLHGLDLVVNNYFYQSVFVPCICDAQKAIVNSQNTRKIAIEKGVVEDRITVINPGTNLPIMPDDKTLANARTRFGIPFEKIMIFVGRITRRKGLSIFIEHSLPVILAAEPRAGLVVVGKNPENSLNQLGEENDVLSLVSKKKYRDHIVFLGQLSDSDLAACYALADVHIFPLVDIPGDVEGFGMVAIEAASLGTPTVAFEVGGVRDAVSSESGCLIEAGEYGRFASAALRILDGRGPSAKSCQDYASKHSWELFNQQVKVALRA